MSGVVEHWVNGERNKLPEGSLVFIRPNDAHGFLYETPDSNNTEYVNLSFSQEIAESIFQLLDGVEWASLLESKMPKVAFLNKNSKNRLLTQFEVLNTIDYKDKAAIEMRLKVILADVFLTYFSKKVDYEPDSKPQWLVQLLKEMEEKENFILGINRMVTLSGKSREHLSRSIRKYLGQSLTEYINSLRINYAANLLINTNIPIIDICMISGFQNLSHFYDVFKTRYGTTPLTFKKNYTM